MLGSFSIAPVRAAFTTTRWLTCPRPDPVAPLRLWCLPFAGGGAAIWHPWAKPLAGVAEIIAVRPPGRENRYAETPFSQLTDLVEAVAEQMAPYVNEDYALCGHSLGGLAAFELARTLRARGINPPQAIIVCGVRAPHHLPDEPYLHPMPQREFIDEVERRYGAIPAEIRNEPEYLELLLPVLRADLQAYETYRYATGTPLKTPILALGGSGDRIVSHTQILDWRAHTEGEFEAELLPGGHFFPQESLSATTARVKQFLRRFSVGGDPAIEEPADAWLNARAPAGPAGGATRF